MLQCKGTHPRATDSSTMSRIFITGSSDGIGLLAARSLISQGHAVTLHARNADRAAHASKSAPGAQGVLIGDLGTLSETKQLADKANESNGGKPFDVVIHNAGVGYTGPFRKTADGLSATFQINSLAPYLLTSLMRRPKRLVYISSGLHSRGRADFDDIAWTKRSWDAYQAYCDSKLQNVIFAAAIARKWPGTDSASVTPGWVATKIDGHAGPGKAEDGADTMTWLAGIDAAHMQGGQLYANRATRDRHPASADEKIQEAYLNACEGLTGVPLPRA